MMQTEFDAVIVGAGPAGSTAANLLARGGWSVALVEKQMFPRRKVCGECIAASNLPLIDALGMGAAIEALAGPELTRLALMQGRRAVVTDIPAAAHAKYRWGRALGRETLDTLLVEQACQSGACVFQPWSVQNLDGVAGNWRFELRAIDSQEEICLRARVAILANGSWEPLPSYRHGRRLARRSSELFAFKANFREAALADGTLPILSLNGGYGGMVVADDALTTVACCVRRERLDALRAASPGMRAGDVIEAWLKRECVGVGLALQAASRAGAWLSAGPIAPGVHFQPEEEFFRIGNAAGEVHPIVGEGISMALQSAVLLCVDLLDAAPGRAAPGAQWQRAVGRHYRGKWRRNFTPRLQLAAAFAHLAMRPAPSVFLMALLRAWPGLLAAGAQWAGKIQCVSYPDLSSIATCPRAGQPAIPADL